jgi:hypothetical protein
MFTPRKMACPPSVTRKSRTETAMSAALWLQVVWEGWFKGEGSGFQNGVQSPQWSFTCRL